MLDDRVAVPRVERPTESVREARPDRDLRRRHLGERRRRDERLPVDGAAVYEHAQPARHVVCARRDRARGSELAQSGGRRRDLPAAVRVDGVPRRVICEPHGRENVGRRRAHAERFQHVARQRVGPRRPVGDARDLAGRDDHRVVVLKRAPEWCGRLRRRCCPHVLVQREDSGFGRQVVVCHQTRPMREHVDQRHLGVGSRIGHLEVRKIFARMVGEADAPRVLSAREQHGGERLRARADREDRIERHG